MSPPQGVEVHPDQDRAGGRSIDQGGRVLRWSAVSGAGGGGPGGTGGVGGVGGISGLGADGLEPNIRIGIGIGAVRIGLLTAGPWVGVGDPGVWPRSRAGDRSGL